MRHLSRHLNQPSPVVRAASVPPAAVGALEAAEYERPNKERLDEPSMVLRTRDNGCPMEILHSNAGREFP